MFCHHPVRRNLTVGSLLRVVNDIDLKPNPDQGTLLFEIGTVCAELSVTGSSLAGFIKSLRRNHQAKAAIRAECADDQCTLLATSSFLEEEHMNIMMIWATRVWPETSCQQWPSFQSSLIPNWNPEQCFLCTWSSTVPEDLKCYTVYLKRIFSPNWNLRESSITQLFCAGFPLLQSNIKLCLTI